MNKLWACISLAVVWILASLVCGPLLVPGPLATGQELATLLGEQQSWRHLLITFFRGSVGIAAAAVFALACGIPCGLSDKLMTLVSPLVNVVQSCPTIIWISLLMVWAGSGSTVPVAAVFVATFPILFVNTVQGTRAVDRRLFQMVKVYRVPWYRVLGRVILPGIQAFSAAAVSYALGISWKVATMAEFIGSTMGAGAQIYWAYRGLNMPRLFSWAIVIIVLGLVVDRHIAGPLRSRSVAWQGGGDDQA